ncbi:STAS domain-containing protein [Streptosporangium album]|nr:STAS domain-containing protein [Streptosporangium album]
MNEPTLRPSGRPAGGAETLPPSWVPLQVIVQVGSDGMTVLSIRGELDIAAERPLRELVGVVISRDTPNALLDLSDVTFCDTSGLQALYLCGEDARALGGTLVLTGLPERMLWLLKISGLGCAFTPVVRASGRSGPPCRPSSDRE